MTAHEIWVTGEILGCLGDRAEWWANNNRDAIDIQLADGGFARLTVETGPEYGQYIIHLANFQAVLDRDGATSLIEASDMTAERLGDALREIAKEARKRGQFFARLASFCEEAST